jgi:hypothetical protein
MYVLWFLKTVDVSHFRSPYHHTCVLYIPVQVFTTHHCLALEDTAAKFRLNPGQCVHCLTNPAKFTTHTHTHTHTYLASGCFLQALMSQNMPAVIRQTERTLCYVSLINKSRSRVILEKRKVADLLTSIQGFIPCRLTAKILGISNL